VDPEVGKVDLPVDMEEEEIVPIQKVQINKTKSYKS